MQVKMREILKKEIQEFHDRLENSYPFFHLISGSQQGESKVVRDFLICQKVCFEKFLQRKSKEHSFFENIGNSLNNISHNIEIDSSLSIIPSATTSDQLIHYEYVLIGSRLGNKEILRKKPHLLKGLGADYFSISFPLDLWGDICDRLNAIHDVQTQREVITCSQMLFLDLYHIGQACNMS